MSATSPSPSSVVLRVEPDLAAELVREDPAVRYAPGLRVDVGAAVDAVTIAGDVAAGVSTIIVATGQLARVARRIANALRRRGRESVVLTKTREDGDMPPVEIPVTDEAILKALQRLLQDGRSPAEGGE